MNHTEILQKLKAGEITDEQAEKMLAELQADAVKEATKKKVTIKVSRKGAIQLDGLRRFPITLYRDEWGAGTANPRSAFCTLPVVLNKM